MSANSRLGNFLSRLMFVFGLALGTIVLFMTPLFGASKAQAEESYPTQTSKPVTEQRVDLATYTVSTVKSAANDGSYTVVSGNNLSTIAAKYGIRWQDLYAWNKTLIGSNPGNIQPGMQLVLHASDTSPPATPAKSAPAAKPAPAPKPPAPSAVSGSVWDKLAMCEASGRWNANTGNGFSGGLQFTPSTWHAFGGTGEAWKASRDTQIAVAQRVLAGQGWGAWPACTARLGFGSAQYSAAMAA